MRWISGASTLVSQALGNEMAPGRLVGQAPAVVPGQRPGVDDGQARVGQAVAELGRRDGSPVFGEGALRFGHCVRPRVM
jgi:hypothetical protein